MSAFLSLIAGTLTTRLSLGFLQRSRNINITASLQRQQLSVPRTKWQRLFLWAAALDAAVLAPSLATRLLPRGGGASRGVGHADKLAADGGEEGRRRRRRGAHGVVEAEADHLGAAAAATRHRHLDVELPGARRLVEQEVLLRLRLLLLWLELDVSGSGARICHRSCDNFGAAIILLHRHHRIEGGDAARVQVQQRRLEESVPVELGRRQCHAGTRRHRCCFSAAHQRNASHRWR
jgi:hypothetical protein